MFLTDDLQNCVYRKPLCAGATVRAAAVVRGVRPTSNGRDVVVHTAHELRGTLPASLIWMPCCVRPQPAQW